MPRAGTNRCRVPSLTSSRPSTKLTRRSANGSAIAEQIANKKGSQVATPGWQQVATHRAMVLQVIEKTGGCRGTRTLDPLIKSQLLYQLSYAPKSLKLNDFPMFSVNEFTLQSAAVYTRCSGSVYGAAVPSSS